MKFPGQKMLKMKNGYFIETFHFHDEFKILLGLPLKENGS